MGSKVTTRGQSSTPPPDVVRSTVTMKLSPSATEAIDERLTVASADKGMWLWKLVHYSFFGTTHPLYYM